MKMPKITKEELQKTGYVYLGEYGGHTTECIEISFGDLKMSS